MGLAISNDLKDRYTEQLRLKYEKSFNEIDQDLTTDPVLNNNNDKSMDTN